MSTTTFILLTVISLFAALLSQSKNVSFNTGNTLLLTAHPDDECMFFAPTLLGLLSDGREHSPNLFSLCLSTGDAERLGAVRQQELHRSLDVLGIPPRNQFILDHPDLKDNFTQYWDPNIIASVIAPFVIENKITTILTFDRQGISGHPNHRALPASVKSLLETHSFHSPPRVFTLATRPIWVKYSGILAPIWFTLHLRVSRGLHLVVSWLLRLFDAQDFLNITFLNSIPNEAATPVFVSGFQDYFRALKAMRQHQSQLVWFRWLYVTFSSYMWVNEWVELS